MSARPYLKADDLKFKDYCKHLKKSTYLIWFESKRKCLRMNFCLSIIVSLCCTLILLLILLLSDKGILGTDAWGIIIVSPSIILIPWIILYNYNQGFTQPNKITALLYNFIKQYISDIDNSCKLSPDQLLFNWKENWYFLSYDDFYFIREKNRPFKAINIAIRFMIPVEENVEQEEMNEYLLSYYHKVIDNIQDFVEDKQYNWSLSSTTQLLIATFVNCKPSSDNDVTEALELLPYLIDRFNLIPYKPEIVK